MKRVILFSLAVAIHLPIFINTSHSAEPLTVCQVLQDLPLYRHKIIEIRGYWYGDTIRDKCEKEIKTGDYVWPNAIYIRTSTVADRRSYEIRSIEKEDWNRAMDELIRLQPGPVTATIVGELNTKDKLEVWAEPKVPLGYGNGMYPAMLLVKGIKDITGNGIDLIAPVIGEPINSEPIKRNNAQDILELDKAK